MESAWSGREGRPEVLELREREDGLKFEKPTPREKKPQARIRRSAPPRRTSRPVARKPKRRSAKSILKALKKKLDILFSRYVKDRDRGEPCITCKRPVEPSNENCGHYVSRGKWSVRWDPKNSHLQCGQPCNGILRGMPQEYSLAILDKYGPEELRRLLARKKVKKQWKCHEVEALVAALERSPAEFETLYYTDNL